MNPPRWRLDQLYSSLDDRRFLADTESIGASAQRLAAWFDDNTIGSGDDMVDHTSAAAIVSEAFDRLDELLSQQRFTRAYVHARASTDAFDDEVARANATQQDTSSEINVLMGRLEAYIGRCSVDELTRLAPDLDAHRYTLDRAHTSARFRMSDAEESLAAELGTNGEAAWRRLRDDIAGRSVVDVGEPVGASMSMAQLRGLATSADAKTRDAAYSSELAAWEELAAPIAASFNAWFGWQLTVTERRGWASPLDAALFDNGIDRSVLDAMTSAVRNALPQWHRFARSKADLLGRGPQLRWSDLVAPLPSDDHVSWDTAVATVRTAFASLSGELASLVDRALSEGWIDAESRVGKRGGAFCMPVGDDVSRVLMNFDHSSDAVQTLAHELGHAFHNTQLAGRTEFQRRTPRALAETASILCETIVADALRASSSASTELALLNTELSGAQQVVVDIHSRFLFEQRLYAARKRSTLSVAELNELMTTAQLEAYGDGLDPQTLHPFMWAVKPHYFTPFYNFPYTFGLLFGTGLVEAWRSDPDTFVTAYNSVLSRTGMDTPVALAGEFGIDLADPDFWATGLASLSAKIDRFVELGSRSE